MLVVSQSVAVAFTRKRWIPVKFLCLYRYHFILFFFRNVPIINFQWWKASVSTGEKPYKTPTRCGVNPPELSLWVSNKWADNKMTQLSICHSINKMFDLLHLLCEWRRSGKSPLVNPQSFCSSALTWIYRFVWVFRSAAWVSKFTLMGI